MMRMMSHDERERFFAAAVRKIRAAAEPLSDAEVQAFSDFDENGRREFQTVWRELREDSRIFLFEALNRAFQRDDLLDFTWIIRAGLDDPDERIRFSALELIPADVPGAYLQPLKELIHDRNEAVRVMAISVLGRYIGERVGAKRAQPRVAEAVSALESIQPEAQGCTAWALMEALALAENPAADAMISKAIHASDPEAVASALRAVRYSLDDRWGENVLSLLDERDTAVLIEAIRAAGALRLGAAREPLMKLLLNFEKFDAVILSELISALANIGGSSARKVLLFLEESLADDSELIEVLEEARDLLDLAEFERTIRSDGADATDTFEAEEWVSDEDYLDQLAMKLDLYLERNGLLSFTEDEIANDPESVFDEEGHDHHHDHDHVHGYGGEFSEFETEYSDEADETEEDDELRMIEDEPVSGKRRTFLDWTDEEVAAFRAAHAGQDFDWEAFLRENEDGD